MLKTHTITAGFVTRMTSLVEKTRTELQNKWNAIKAEQATTVSSFVKNLTRFYGDARVTAAEETRGGSSIEVAEPRQTVSELMAAADTTIGVLKRLHDLNLEVPEGQTPDVAKDLPRSVPVGPRVLTVQTRTLPWDPDNLDGMIVQYLSNWDGLGSEADPYPLPEKLAIPAELLVSCFAGDIAELDSKDAYIVPRFKGDDELPEVPAKGETVVLADKYTVTTSDASDSQKNLLFELFPEINSWDDVVGFYSEDHVELTRDQFRLLEGLAHTRITQHEIVLG